MSLRGIDPIKIIDPEDKVFEREEGVFLTLSFFYNLFRDLHYFLISLEKDSGDSLRKMAAQENAEPTPELGEYLGRRDHIIRLMACYTYEFLIFLQKNQSYFIEGEFKNILDKLPLRIQKSWGEIFREALLDSKQSDFKCKLKYIRTNFTYHYDATGEKLRDGYIENFFKSPAQKRNSQAYYSLGSSMKETRFYFADAAVSGAINSKTDAHLYDRLSFYSEKINNTLYAIIGSLLEEKE